MSYRGNPCLISKCRFLASCNLLARYPNHNLRKSFLPWFRRGGLFASWNMSASCEPPVARLTSHVILDLDGTLLNTDGIVNEVLNVYLAKYGKRWDTKKARSILGKTPFEAAKIIVADYELPCTIEDFMAETNPLFTDQ